MTSTSKPHAEIAGAGLAGLTAAVALAERGWSVRVHERYQSLRSQGFGITTHANGLRVLKAVGAYEDTVRDANPLSVSELRDSEDRLISHTRYRAQSIRVSRYRLVAALAERGRALGVELAFNSAAAGADRAGELRLESGPRLKADLVIGADGINSRVRDSLDLIRSRRIKADGAMRLVIPRLPEEVASEDANKVIEWWSGNRRIIYGACSPTELYIALVARADDPLGCQAPIDRASWIQAFPKHGALFERIHRDAEWDKVMWVPFQVLKLTSWSAGRVAIAGDAAHAMPPNLGQGGGCSLMNVLALAVILEETGNDVERALSLWEQRERPLTEHTQFWSQLYSVLTAWPRALREPAFALLGLPWMQKQYRRTSNHIGTGTEHVN